MFGHEQFHAYQYSLQFAARSVQIMEKLPEGYSKLVDQLRRATIAISLNIAEGSEKTSESQKRHCYAIARGEAMECAAIMHILECMQLIDSATAKEAKDNLTNVVRILSAVCRPRHRT